MIILFLFVFILSIIFFKISIPLLHKFKFGQVVRTDGPETHLKKQGTPTMGGIVFVISYLISNIIFLIVVIYLNYDTTSFINVFNFLSLIIICVYIIPICLSALIGFIDDYKKIKYKNSKGLNAKYKFLFQIIVSSLFMFIMIFIMNKKYLENPFTNKEIIFGNESLTIIITFLINIFIITGTTNGVNFTDGLDGLLASITTVVSIFYIFVAYRKNEGIVMFEIVIILAIILSFLIFNHYPAKLFMGDTGSLFLGFYVASIAIILDIQLLLPIFGFIYFIEVISVILQVWYFKKTGGKRLFKMAPIHHHFEKLGFSENQIVFYFTGLTLILCLISYFIEFGF